MRRGGGGGVLSTFCTYRLLCIHKPTNTFRADYLTKLSRNKTPLCETRYSQLQVRFTNNASCCSSLNHGANQPPLREHEQQQDQHPLFPQNTLVAATEKNSNQETADRNRDEANRLSKELKSVRDEMDKVGKSALERVGEERAAAEAKARALEDR